MTQGLERFDLRSGFFNYGPNPSYGEEARCRLGGEVQGWQLGAAAMATSASSGRTPTVGLGGEKRQGSEVAARGVAVGRRGGAAASGGAVVGGAGVTA